MHMQPPTVHLPLVAPFRQLTRGYDVLLDSILFFIFCEPDEKRRRVAGFAACRPYDYLYPQERMKFGCAWNRRRDLLI